MNSLIATLDKSLETKTLFECKNDIDQLELDIGELKKNITNCRNIIYCCDKYEVVLINWCENKKSGIHDHPKNGCLLKMLEGSLKETRYNAKLEKMSEQILTATKIGNTNYICGSDILHNIESGNERSLSLHIYSPPKYTPNYFRQE